MGRHAPDHRRFRMISFKQIENCATVACVACFVAVLSTPRQGLSARTRTPIVQPVILPECESAWLWLLSHQHICALRCAAACAAARTIHTLAIIQTRQGAPALIRTKMHVPRLEKVARGEKRPADGDDGAPTAWSQDIGHLAKYSWVGASVY